MENILKNIVKGFHCLGFGTSLIIILWIWLLFIIVDGPVARYFETLLNIPHMIHMYDVVLIILFIIFNAYIFYLTGKYNL